jgi:hypothetical protein
MYTLNMTSNLRQKIYDFIKKNHQATIKEMVDFFDVPKQTLYWHIPKMLEHGEIKKIGKAPKVFYIINDTNQREISPNIKENDKNIINDNYLIITSSGEKLSGMEGFAYWCRKHGQNIEKTAKEYIDTLAKYSQYKTDGLVFGIEKFKNTFKDNNYLNEIYYLDFYSIERFGKTKLGQLLLYGKQSGNKKLIKEIIEIVKPKIDKLIASKNIDAVLFVPWTVKREIQFMRELQKGLELRTPLVTIEKIQTDITVPQKTLSKLEDRIENAERTMIVTDKRQFNRVLIIDDAVGSGATLNEIARQIKQKNIAKNVIGLAITGSFKGFDVISEV